MEAYLFIPFFFFFAGREGDRMQQSRQSTVRLQQSHGAIAVLLSLVTFAG